MNVTRVTRVIIRYEGQAKKNESLSRKTRERNFTINLDLKLIIIILENDGVGKVKSNGANYPCETLFSSNLFSLLLTLLPYSIYSLLSSLMLDPSEKA